MSTLASDTQDTGMKVFPHGGGSRNELRVRLAVAMHFVTKALFTFHQ